MGPRSCAARPDRRPSDAGLHMSNGDFNDGRRKTVCLARGASILFLCMEKSFRVERRRTGVTPTLSGGRGRTSQERARRRDVEDVVVVAAPQVGSRHRRRVPRGVPPVARGGWPRGDVRRGVPAEPPDAELEALVLASGPERDAEFMRYFHRRLAREEALLYPVLREQQDAALPPLR